MNKKAEFAWEVVLILVTIVLTSALVFTLVQAGVIEVEQNSNQEMLLMEFIPVFKEDKLVISKFRFCNYESSLEGCFNEQEIFKPGERVHFAFQVLTSVSDGNVYLVENYRLLDPNGEVLIEIREEYNREYQLNSESNEETVYYKDYFILGTNSLTGQYTLELLVKNSLSNKELVLIKKFIVAN